MVFVISGLLIGAILGAHRSALSLIPAVGLALVAAELKSLVGGQVIFSDVVWLMIAMQAGFVLTAALRFGFERTSRTNSIFQEGRL